jgi:hypothetical protein
MFSGGRADGLAWAASRWSGSTDGDGDQRDGHDDDRQLQVVLHDLDLAEEEPSVVTPMPQMAAPITL